MDVRKKKETSDKVRFTESKTTLSQLPALQLDGIGGDNPNEGGIARCCIAGGRAYIVMTGGPAFGTQSQDTLRFFNSFRITNGGKSAGGGGPGIDPGGGPQPKGGSNAGYSPPGGRFSVDFP